MHLVMTLAEVCDALALSTDAFYRRRRRLEAAGFPRPLAGAGTRWSRRLVHNWIEGGEAPAAPIGHYIAETRDYLAAKYAGRAA